MDKKVEDVLKPFCEKFGTKFTEEAVRAVEEWLALVCDEEELIPLAQKCCNEASDEKTAVTNFFQGDYHHFVVGMNKFICGFEQSELLNLAENVTYEGKTKKLHLDITDIVILRGFSELYPNLDKKMIKGTEYAKVSYDEIAEYLPILRIKKKAIAERLKKMCLIGILKHKTIKQNGTFSFYAFGEKYPKLAKGGGIKWQ